jgi:hypothetical protein
VLYFLALALGGEAVILFERYEQKDKSGTPDPQGNAQVKIKITFSYQKTLIKNKSCRDLTATAAFACIVL